MRVTKRQLKRIIKEEKRKLRESWGDSVETGSTLIDFAKAYAGLGNAVQQQVEALSNAWLLQGAHEPDWSEAVYEQNPNAIDMAVQRLSPGLKFLAREGVDEAEALLDMLEEAQKTYEQGDAEVEADAAAAGDRPTPRSGVSESLLREAMGDLPVLGGQLPYEEDSDSSRFAESEIENSIIHTLENNPGIGGMALAQKVMGEVSGADQNSVFSFLDVLLEDGVVYFNDEEDAWHMASDTPHEVDKEWDIL